MVEDDPVQRERVGAWLEDQHWVMQEAANGREALARLQEEAPEEAPDVILLDLMMPEMDGDDDDRNVSPASLFLQGGDQRSNSGVQSVLVKEMFRFAELEHIRRIVHTSPEADNKMEEAAS